MLRSDMMEGETEELFEFLSSVVRTIEHAQFRKT